MVKCSVLNTHFVDHELRAVTMRTGITIIALNKSLQIIWFKKGAKLNKLSKF